MLTLSRVMMPWDWIGIVTIRSDTRSTRSINGMKKIRPGPAGTVANLAEVEQHRSLVLLEHANARCEQRERDENDCSEHHEDHANAPPAAARR